MFSIRLLFVALMVNRNITIEKSWCEIIVKALRVFILLVKHLVWVCKWWLSVLNAIGLSLQHCRRLWHGGQPRKYFTRINWVNNKFAVFDQSVFWDLVLLKSSHSALLRHFELLRIVFQSASSCVKYESEHDSVSNPSQSSQAVSCACASNRGRV